MKLLQELLELFEAVDITTLNIDSIKPDKKDADRAEGLQFRGKTFHGDNSPWASEAAKMAKLIKDPVKLVRRAKAVAQLYGTRKVTNPEKDAWTPFLDALERMNFSQDQIKKVIESGRGYARN